MATLVDSKHWSRDKSKGMPGLALKLDLSYTYHEHYHSNRIYAIISIVYIDCFPLPLTSNLKSSIIHKSVAHLYLDYTCVVWQLGDMRAIEKI